MGSGLVTVVLKKPSHSSRPYSPAEREGVWVEAGCGLQRTCTCPVVVPVAGVRQTPGYEGAELLVGWVARLAHGTRAHPPEGTVLSTAILVIIVGVLAAGNHDLRLLSRLLPLALTVSWPNSRQTGEPRCSAALSSPPRGQLGCASCGQPPGDSSPCKCGRTESAEAAFLAAARGEGMLTVHAPSKAAYPPISGSVTGALHCSESPGRRRRS